ncbi:FAD:protein FMN transferase [Streptococcus sp. X16XC17]|uniref:FAD:protein FMN transferase n=1 Tax=unclassified Streptococcus TaxID=2608887 RepID=UPI00066FBC36|nr:MULTISPECIES: FAD:protein FMN transferase [unclassified Streptococcus]TCD46214.1 FAD:protein FMN transferase [Streptococcus sp. X16XC17]
MEANSRSVRLMGTVIEVKIWHENPEPILDQVEEMLYLYKNRFSANDLTSELMEVNLNAGVQPVPVAPDLYELIALGKEHTCAPNSHLNIAIGPLVQAWRIGFSDAQVPDQETIDRALELIRPEDIELDPEFQQVYLKKQGMLIDLGALAKGYIADRVVDFLKRVGIQQGLINLGGNVLTFGKASHNEDGLWRIGIQNPTMPRGNNIAVIKTGEESVVTSGIYERTFEVEGKTYHHIFDSQTGYPVESDVASITIVSQKSIDGEIWTTRLFGCSVRDILEEVNQVEAIEVIVVTKDQKMFCTQGLRERFM